MEILLRLRNQVQLLLLYNAASDSHSASATSTDSETFDNYDCTISWYNATSHSNLTTAMEWQCGMSFGLQNRG